MKRDSKNQCKFFLKLNVATSLRELIKWTWIGLILIATLFSPDPSGLASRLTEVLIKDLVGVMISPAVSQPARPDGKSDLSNPGQTPGFRPVIASGKTKDLCPRR